MADKSVSARELAVTALGQVLGEGRMLSDVIARPDWRAASPSTRAAAQRLTADTLRQLARADVAIQSFISRDPPARVMNVLRMAAVELQSGGAAHGVVNDAVNLVAANKKTRPMKGMVNAVLRKVAAMTPEDWAKPPAAPLPSWLRRPLVGAWGKERVAAMEAVHALGAPTDVTVKADAEGWADKLGGTVLPTGSIRLNDPRQISGLPGFDDGAWWVQDAAAALPVKLLGDVRGKTVLDLCAAPGGKTLQLAAAGADLTALDISDKRMVRVRENLDRTGLPATCVTADAMQYKHDGFDAVLLDAPCSATGTIRRHPDLPHIKSRTAVRDLMALQRDLIRSAVRLLKPGGTLVFCTCSLLPEEGEVQMRWALAQDDLGLDALPAELPGMEPDWTNKDGGVRLRPDVWADRGGLDGFFMCVFRQNGQALPS